jgi:hypothetical protein
MTLGPIMLRLELQDFMRRTMAGEKIDVPKVITKSDAEKILRVPVKDAKGRNQNGTGVYYDSE